MEKFSRKPQKKEVSVISKELAVQEKSTEIHHRTCGAELTGDTQERHSKKHETSASSKMH